jgi:hypothetical protein
MTVIAPTTPFGSVIFCDEVRHEANGKHIYIGVYVDGMYVHPSFPAKVASLSVVIKYIERRGDSSNDVVLRVFFPGEEKAAFEATALRKDVDAVQLPEGPEVDDPFVQVMIVAQFRELVIKQAGWMKVRAYLGDDEIKLGTMHIRLAPGPLNAMGVSVQPSSEAAN